MFRDWLYCLRKRLGKLLAVGFAFWARRQDFDRRFFAATGIRLIYLDDGLDNELKTEVLCNAMVALREYDALRFQRVLRHVKTLVISHRVDAVSFPASGICILGIPEPFLYWNRDEKLQIAAGLLVYWASYIKYHRRTSIPSMAKADRLNCWCMREKNKTAARLTARNRTNGNTVHDSA